MFLLLFFSKSLSLGEKQSPNRDPQTSSNFNAPHCRRQTRIKKQVALHHRPQQSPSDNSRSCCHQLKDLHHVSLFFVNFPRQFIPPISPICIFIQNPATAPLKERSRSPFYSSLSHFAAHIHSAPFCWTRLYTYLHLYCEEEPRGMTMDFSLWIFIYKRDGVLLTSSALPASAGRSVRSRCWTSKCRSEFRS